MLPDIGLAVSHHDLDVEAECMSFTIGSERPWTGSNCSLMAMGVYIWGHELRGYCHSVGIGVVEPLFVKVTR
jgi:hypothetical protein